MCDMYIQMEVVMEMEKEYLLEERVFILVQAMREI